MKNIYLSIISFLMFTTIGFSQCNNIVISTQAQVDSFSTNFAGCSSVSGYLIISGSDITNLNGLSQLISVNGNLSIYDVPNLSDYSGLNNLTTLTGDFSLLGNTVANISGFSGLINIGGHFNLYNLPNLVLFSGLNNVASIDGFFYVSSNASLTALPLMSSLTSIGGSLTIQANQVLNDLTALNNLTAINGTLYVSANNILTSLTGLQNINPTTITNLYLNSNGQLVTCDMPNLCSYLTNGGFNTLSGNASGCNTVEEIQANCNEGTYAISCPVNVEVNTDTGYCASIVNDINPITTPVDAIYTYSLTGDTTGSGSGSASGLTFNKGVTTVTYTLTNDNTKTCSFTVTVNGEPAEALNFDGINDYVSIPALNLNSNTVTMEAWIKPTGLQGDYDGIVFSRSGSTIAGFGIKANNEIEYHWNNDGLTYAWSSGAIAPPNEWSHVALVVEPAKATIYLNGVAHVNNVTHAIEEFNGITRIGKDDPFMSQDRQFKGVIEEVRIWNRSLCTAEIVNNSIGELTVPQQDLVAYYKFNQGLSSCENTGSTSLLDSSGNNLNGTLNIFALTGATSNWTTGNVSGTSPDFEHTPPVINCPASISVFIDAPNTTAIVDFIATATDDSGIASIAYSKDPNTEFPLGATEVIVTATDNNCNSSTCSFTVTVLENENPEIHWQSIASGVYQNVGIKSDGTLWAWGNNNYGQLGDGTNTNKNIPVQIGIGSNWKSIASGWYHTIGIQSNGTLWAWGNNNSGELGDGTTTSRNIPVQIGTATDWKSIAAGDSHSVAIKSDGTLWAWGNNGYGQLGDGTNINKNLPVQIGSALDWHYISTGGLFSFSIKTDGTLWAWGYNGNGQLGDGTNTNKNIPVKIGTETNWNQLVAEYLHTVALKSDGTLWAWGYNGNGQLGDGTYISKNTPIQIGTDIDWYDIAVGGYHSSGLKLDGALWTWGNNSYGELGDGTNTNRNTPMLITTETNFQNISARGQHIIGLKFEGLQFCATGYNIYGQLGDGTNINKNSFICIPTNIPYAITCPESKEANTDTGYCTAVVNGIDAIVTPNNSPYIYILIGDTVGSGNGSASGLTFNKGVTTVTYTLTADVTKTCSFTVTVNDVEIPTIVCAPDVIINNTPGQCIGTTVLINPTVNDNCNASFGNALNFDGGYVDVPHNNLLNPIDQFTVEAWLKRASNNMQESLIEKYSNGVNTFGYLLRITPENKPFTMVLNASNQGTGVAGGTTILPNVWYHLAATFNRNTGVLKLYVNGILDGEVNGISGLPTTPGAQSLKIGARGDDAATRLTNGGIIDEVRIWNIERSQAQIQADFNNELNIQPGLVALYHFNQGLAGGNNSASPGPAINTATDASGNGFNGTLNGFTLTGTNSNWVLGNAEVETLDITNDAPATYSEGDTTVTWTVTDANNNTATCTQTVTVVDAESPTIVCAPDIIINNTPGLCTGTITLVNPTVNDNCRTSFGNALNFDGGYVNIPHNNLINPTDNLTIETWVKFVSGGKSLIEKYTSQADSFGYLLRISPENKVFTMVLNYDGPQLTGSTTLLPNVWYHLASTYNRTAGVLKVYVNGVLDGQINGITGLPVTPSNGSLKIGARGDDAAISNNGDVMDEVRIWNIERSQAQIQADFNNELNAQPGLVALYHFNQGFAGGNNSASPGPAINTSTDDSGNEFNGTLNGFALTGLTSNWAEGYIAGELISLTNDAPVTYPLGETTVTWTAIDQSNNSTICTQKVTVIDAELPYITAPTELHYTRTANNGLCFYDVEGGEFDLAATDNCQLISFFYSMVNNNAGLSSTGESLSGISLAEGINIIDWTATDINGNSSTISFEVEVLKGDITVAASDSEICNGESSQLTVSGAVSYFWSPSASLSSNTGTSVIATPTQTTTYMVTGTGDVAGCSISKEIIITVTPLPIVTLGAFSPVCVNTSPFVLTGGLPSGGVYSGSGVNSGSFNPSVAGVGSHLITYTFIDGNGCSNSANISIQVNGPIANAGSDKTVYPSYTQNKCATLSGSASGGLPPYKYLWSTGAKTASINVCPTVTTTYTLRVTDASGCFKTDDVVVNAIDISCGKNSVYVCHNNSATCVKTNDVKIHLAHGDYLGTCNNAVSFSKKTNTSIIENNDTFILYPNPTTGSFTVEVCKKNVVKGAKLQVVNTLGQIIYSKKAFKIEGCIKETIELSHILPEGMYSLNLIIGENVETQKIILTK